VPTLGSALRPGLDQAAATVAAALGPGEQAVPLDVVYRAAAAGSANRDEPVIVGVRDAPHSIRSVTNPYVATPELLALYGIDPASIAPATELLTALDPDGLVLADATVRPDGALPPTVQRVTLPTDASAPSVLITEQAVTAHGWSRTRAGWIVESPHPLSAGEIRDAQAAAAQAGLGIEVRSVPGDMPGVRTGVAIGGAALAMAIIAIALGLIRGESARDLRTLTATGAAPRTRRTLTASTAAALAVLGVVLGTGAAYLALVAVYHTDLTQLLPVPLEQLVPLAVGLPVLATGVGWLLAGREPRSIARQALD
jgi:putative ABC transport system permease protein